MRKLSILAHGALREPAKFYNRRSPRCVARTRGTGQEALMDDEEAPAWEMLYLMEFAY